jgi:hypothetical protein
LQEEQALGEERGKAGSPALLAAQQKLQILREQHGVHNKWPASSNRRGRSPSSPTNVNPLPTNVPDHLGWGSVRLTAALKAAQEHQAKVKVGRPDGNPSPIPFPQPKTSEFKGRQANSPIRGQKIRLYPDLALGMLRQKQEAAGRIWLLLQFMDEAGRGWILLDEVRRRLAQKDSPLYVCGQRQLRKLLARGDGLFWQRDDHRIWLRSTVKVAAGLSIHRLSGHPVALPIEALLQGIGHVRAHFYASFHSGRNQQKSHPAGSRPISRAKLEKVCHVSRRTQRRYEKRAAVGQQSNFAIGQANREDDLQEQAWLRGRAVFHFIDHEARLGRKGKCYTAWQLPNNYIGPHQRQPKGRQKRMNRELADLFKEGMTGNGDELVHGIQPGHGRLFYDRGYSAAASYNRSPDRDLYWRSRLRQPNHYQLWHVLPAKEAG